MYYYTKNPLQFPAFYKKLRFHLVPSGKLRYNTTNFFKSEALFRMLLATLSAVSLETALLICFFCGSFTGLAWLWVLPVSFLGTLLLLAGLAFVFLLYLCSKVDQDVPQDGDDPLYRTAVNLYLESIIPCLRVHIKTVGMEKVPQSGRFLLVCNHNNDSDPIVLLRIFHKYQLAFISKKENKSMFVIGPMMHKIQCQLIDRENDREALKTILRCIQILKEDKASVAVFPEGGILSEDEKLHPFRPGVFKIAQKAKVPIVVCTLRGTVPVMHNIKHFKPSHVEMRLVDVIPAEELAGVTTVDIAKRVHDIMAKDLGPERIAD